MKANGTIDQITNFKTVENLIYELASYNQDSTVSLDYGSIDIRGVEIEKFKTPIGEIDTMILPIIELLNDYKVETFFSCSGHPEKEDYIGYIFAEYNLANFMLFETWINNIDKGLLRYYPVKTEALNDRSLYHPVTVIELDKSMTEARLGKTDLIIRFKLCSLYQMLSFEEFYKLAEEALKDSFKEFL